MDQREDLNYSRYGAHTFDDHVDAQNRKGKLKRDLRRWSYKAYDLEHRIRCEIGGKCLAWWWILGEPLHSSLRKLSSTCAVDALR
eukprot:SM000150S01696  [mRNA]  locus=s150:62380:63095:+ [translate_table: standard]